MARNIILAASALLPAALAAAAPPAPQPSQTAPRAALVCLVMEAVPGRAPVHVAAPARDAAALTAKGFVKADCRDAAFDRDRQATLRDRMCRIAADEPEGIQLQFERMLGERPAVLCGVTEAAQGAWDSRGGVR